MSVLGLGSPIVLLNIAAISFHKFSMVCVLVEQ